MTMAPNGTTAEDGGDSSSNSKEPAIAQPTPTKASFSTTASATPKYASKSSAPFPNKPDPTDWSKPADLTHVRANTPHAPAPPPQQLQLQPPVQHEIPVTPRAVRSKSDASTKSGGRGGAAVFKRMFGGGGGGSAVDANEHVRSGFGQMNLGNGPYSPGLEQSNPMADTNHALSTNKPGLKAGSVDGRDQDTGQRFNLRDLLGSGTKLVRKSSASSRRSDTSSAIGDAIMPGQTGYTSGPESIPRPRSRGASSVAGESTTSLSKKYGVCERTAIGKGATSVVRLAHKWDRKEEKLYAVKEFRKRRKNESEKDYVKKLTAEFCISSTLHHPNIVETVDLVQDEHQNWCEVMEYCPGGDLYAAIKRGGMSPSEVECSFKQILLGLGYLHSQGVAHRDIKPENIFFDAKGQLKIGDYGASTVYRLPWESTVHMSTGLCGSEPYIAPEQFTSKHYDARLVDIWACGIVYYCLHFQELPWRVAQMSDTLYAAYVSATQAKSSSEADCPPTINNLSPRACRPLLRRMLEPKPSARILIEDVLKDKWLAGIEVCSVATKPNHIHVHARHLTSGGSV